MVRRKSTNPSKVLFQQKKKTSVDVVIANKIFKVSQHMLHEINRLRGNTKNQIPKLPFARLVREIMQSVGGMEYRIQALALSALLEAAEIHIVHFFEDSNLATAHARRVTVTPKDMQLVKSMRARYEPNLYS